MPLNNSSLQSRIISLSTASEKQTFDYKLFKYEESASKNQ